MTPADFRAARATLGLTQRALAERLHCTRLYVSYIETGRRTPSETLCALLETLLLKVACRVALEAKPRRGP